MKTAEVVAAGWHDTTFRWDISTPQRVVARLEKLPGQGSLATGRKLYAERDRFGKWLHALGSQHTLISYATPQGKRGLIRRLEVQAHLGQEGEDDLCSPSAFETKWKALQTRMALLGVLPPEDPRCVRIDTAVDVAYGDPLDGQRVLEALRYARWPGKWYAEWQGPPPYTTVAIKRGSHTVGRVYCRNTKLRNERPRWGKLRFESERRFDWQMGRQLSELSSVVSGAVYWSAVFGAGRASGRVTRVAREIQTLALIERVEAGEITTAQFEQLTAFLDTERLGVVEHVYKLETARRRRKLAREVGISPADGDSASLDVDLDRMMEVPRSAWPVEVKPVPALAPAA
jgi:hypothetical protein